MCVFKDLDLILKKIKDGNTKIIKNKWAADFFIPAFFVIFNYYKFKTITLTVYGLYTLLANIFIMEQAIQIIESRVRNLQEEQSIQYMGGDYYDELQARISELESLLDELQNVR